MTRSHWPISILSTLSSLVNMALPLILVRILPPSELGVFKIFFLYLMVFPAFTLISGVSSGLSYWAGRGEEGKKAIRTSGLLFLVISTLALIVITTFKFPLAALIHLDAEWLTLFSLALFFGIASLFYEDAAIATGRIWTGALFNSGFELLRTLAIVATAIETHDLKMIIKAHILVQGLETVVGYTMAFKQDLFRWEWSTEVFSKVKSYSIPVSLAFVFGLWLNYADQIILSHSITASAFALYTVCCLSVPPLLVLEASVTRVLIPELSQAFSEGRAASAATLYKKAVSELSTLIIPAVVGLAIFASPIIELFFTKTYLEGAPFLRLYSLWYLTLLIPPDSVARARGQAKWILINFVSFAVFTVLLCATLAHFFGATGALLGLLIGRFCSRAYTIAYVRQSLSWKLSAFIPFRKLTEVTLVSLTLGAASLLVHPLFKSELTWFFTCTPAFIAIYFLSLFLLSLGGKAVSNDRGQKVLMLTPGLFIGGLERMILSLSKNLKLNSSWSPQVLAYDFMQGPHQPADLVAHFTNFEIPVVSRTKAPRFSLKTVIHLAGHISKNKISVIHTHDLGALIYGALAKVALLGRIRLVHTQHSFVHLSHSWKYRYYECFFTRFADSVASVSHSVAEDTQQISSTHAPKFHIIPNGVEFPNEPTLDASVQKERKKKLFKDSDEEFREDFWILYLARIHGGKGQDQALRLWSELDPLLRKQTVLIFVGPETQTGELSKLRDALQHSPDSDRVIFAGPSQNPREWIEASDLFLSCSEFEGMPLAPIEALGSGIPGVLSHIAGHEFLIPYCELYSLDEPKLGAKAVERAIRRTQADREAYRQSLWKHSEEIRSRFTVKAMSKKYEALYKA